MSNDKRTVWLFILILAIIAAVNGLYMATRAQEQATWFNVTCLESLDTDHYRLHFGYESQGGETFTVAFDAQGRDVFVTTPPTFTTEAGYHDAWYMDAHSADSPYALYVTFTSDRSIQTLALNTWDSVWCTNDAYATPEPPSDLPWAIDASTGAGYQYQPQVGGVVPLPAAMGG